jgi:phosphate transport system substrate-binding protein
VIAFSFLFLISSCTAVSNTSNQSQQKLEARVVKIDGSSTVFPITEAIAKDFQKMQGNNVKVTVAVSGTGGGF